MRRPRSRTSLLAEHGELATVQSLAAEIALQQGDLATAHDRWSAQLADDPSRIAPLLAMARIALLGGDLDEARSPARPAPWPIPRS